jgi:hypothetical protein
MKKPRVLAWLNAAQDIPYWARLVDIIPGNAQLFKDPLSVQPDLIYVESIGYESLKPWNGLKYHVPIVQWMGDSWGGYPPHIVTFNPRFTTATYVVDHEAIHAAAARGLTNVAWRHFGSEHLYFPKDVLKTINVVFTGQSYGGNNFRCETVTRIQRNFPGVVVYGNGWDGILEARPAIPNTAVNDVYAQSKIVLCHDINNVRGFTSVRTFNALIGGHFVLMKKMPGLLESLGLEHKKHLVTYNDADEALSHINHYVNFATHERERIAAAGRERAIALGLRFDDFVRSIASHAKA